MRARVFWSGLLLLLSLVNTAAAADIRLDEAWVSKPLSERSSSVAAFAVITNASDIPLTIIGASSDYAESVELHRIVHEEGLVRMRSVAEITIPPVGEIRLNADGLHLMLTGLQKIPWTEAHISIQLHLKNGDEVIQRFELRGGNQPAGKEHSHH
jgi:copper(I)-binding protein